MAYDFHYTPTGTGVISGKEVLEQTEDAINDLGNTAISGVQEALDKAEQALTNSENAVDDAQTALNTANNAEGVAIQAQTDVGNLSGTVTNIGNRVTTAESNISNLQGRMTTAESNITNIQGRMTTAETNIGNLQTAVSTAQATANSAQQTATTARQQSYVFRYSSTALVASSTNSNALLDNTDNLKVGDKVIDSSGVLFSITAIDTQNSTFTIGTALIDLAKDSDVVHKSGNETITGTKTFDNVNLPFKNSSELGVSDGNTNIIFSDKNGQQLCALKEITYSSGTPAFQINLTQKVDNTIYTTNGIALYQQANSKVIQVIPTLSNGNVDGLSVWLGSSLNTFSRIYGLSYYYGNDNVEFSTKFVTTDTDQTISGNKTFSSNTLIYNSDNTANTPNLILQSSKIQLGDTTNSDTQGIVFNAGYSFVAKVESFKDTAGTQNLQNTVRTKDTSNNVISAMYRLRLFNSGFAVLESNYDNTISLGRNNAKWKDCQTYLVNGLTPSSLGMPVAPSTTSYVDISGYITVLDSSSANTYTPPSNGYITFSVTGNLVQIFHEYGLQGKWTVQAGNANRGFIPVLGGVEVKIYLTASSVDKFWFIPCQGNV